MSHVFISYAHADAEFAENVQHQLEKSGMEVWIDEQRLRVGEDWREEIDQALSEAFVLILIMSPASMESKYVMYEWSFAWGKGTKVVPILYKQVQADQIHPRLDKRQYLDFVNRAARSWDGLIKTLTEIQSEVASQQAYVIKQHDPPTVEKKIDERTQKLLQILYSEYDAYEERIAAIKLLRQLKDKDSLDAIVAALRGNELWQVRMIAAQTLGDFGDSKATLKLLVVLQSDDNPDVRACAAEALGRIGDEIAVPSLIERLSDRDKLATENGEVNGWVVVALQLIGTKEALDAVKVWNGEMPF